MPRIETTGWSEDRKRYWELTQKYREGELTVEEDRESARLWERIRVENIKALPLPTCCKQTQSYPAVHLSVSEVEVGVPETAVWYPVLVDSLPPDNEREPGPWYKSLPEAHFCPYCGKALPKMQRKATPPLPLRVFTDGGYYCDTCGERGNGCVCFPREAAFEPVP